MSGPAHARARASRTEVALALLRAREEPTPQQLAATGFASLAEVAQAVADAMRLPRLELDGLELAPELAELLPQVTAERQRLAPVFATAEEVTVATSDPARIEVLDWLSRELRRQVIVVVATGPEVERATRRLYARRVTPVAEPAPGAVTAAQLEEAAPVVDRLIFRAVEMRASDLHLEATEQHTVVRYRVDGALRQVEARPVAQHPALVSRLKVLAQLDISERNAPQDGRIKLKRAEGGEVDLRVSVLPTYFGEKVCCRVLDNSRACLPLAELGFEEAERAAFERMIRSPYGLVLVTGPTGSGKSTTLYGALNAVRSPELNLVSVEDPVEYQLPGINQVQVNPKRGLTFAGALRSILRQDPNVILVGEIRDRETGCIAAEAALTGHLVLSSLHTNDAPGAVARLTEMGIEPFVVAPSLVGVVAQRLVRKLCPACAEPYAPDPLELELLGLPALPEQVELRRPRGCAECAQTGYRGRAPVRELLEITGALKPLVARGASGEELRAAAEQQGFRPMRLAALRKYLAGETSAQEVVRLTRA